MVAISACKTPHERSRFEKVAEDLHSGDPAYIPPYPGSIARYLASDSAFHQRHGEILPLIATRNGRAVGRIAAIINRSHNAQYGDRTGFFGFFECENDPETARALFERAAEILRSRGLQGIRGPYNPSINDECGLLVEGFEHAPFIGLTWNPAYYEALVSAQGFHPVCTSFGLQLPLHRLAPPERLKRIVDRVARRSRLKLRPIKLERLEDELKIVLEVYNDTLKRNWGFVPITMEDLLFAADDLRAIADPEMILIAEQDGQNAGVGLSLPNFNELLALTKKTPRWLRPLHILWLMKTRPIRSGRQVVYGISPRFRDRGLHGWLLYEQFVCAKARYENAELGWIEDTNTEILDNSVMLGGERHRTWKIFEKAL
ncbi:MAG TPA: hypothetical protein PLS03_02695 [Terrimicrobiaceae bacterium]|nr:hypothetical protein [Terrimicrobiaceae bacterium]